MCLIACEPISTFFLCSLQILHHRSLGTSLCSVLQKEELIFETLLNPRLVGVSIMCAFF